MRGFQIYGDCMLPTIPVIFEINTLCGLLISTLNYDFFFQISLQFLRGFQATGYPHDNYMHVTGYPVQHGVFPYFLWGKNLQCTVVYENCFQKKIQLACDLKKMTVNIEILTLLRSLGPSPSGTFHILIEIQRVPTLSGFWALKKTALRKICVIGNVGDPLLTQKSPTCAYISQKWL